MCDQPFSAAKDQPFIDLVRTLNPLAHVVCDKTIIADLVVEYKKKIEELKVELASVPGKISITLESWLFGDTVLITSGNLNLNC